MCTRWKKPGSLELYAGRHAVFALCPGTLIVMFIWFSWESIVSSVCVMVVHAYVAYLAFISPCAYFVYSVYLVQFVFGVSVTITASAFFVDVSKHYLARRVSACTILLSSEVHAQLCAVPVTCLFAPDQLFYVLDIRDDKPGRASREVAWHP